MNVCLLFVSNKTPLRSLVVRFPLAPWGFFQVESHTSDIKTGTPVATPPGDWRYRVSAETHWVDSKFDLTDW